LVVSKSPCGQLQCKGNISFWIVQIYCRFFLKYFCFWQYRLKNDKKFCGLGFANSLCGLKLKNLTKSKFFKMKKSLTLLLVAAVAVFIGACAKTNNPEAVVKEFVMALDSKDFKKAADLGTDDTDKMVELLKSFDAMQGDKKDAKAEKHAKAEKVSCEEKGDAATCKFCCTAEGKDETYQLVKKDGKWLVDMKKDPSIGGGGESNMGKDTTDVAAPVEETAPKDKK
jgi:ketosteroid isomerase-like protein